MPILNFPTPSASVRARFPFHGLPGLLVAAPLGITLLACTPASSDDDGFTFSTTIDPGDGDGDGDAETTGDGDGDGDPGGGSCGDGVLDVGEECDFGDSNSDTGTCTTSCLVAECGDGFVLEGLEECDDGNSVNTDDCVDECKAAFCGDGFTQAGVEECDDANDDEADGCTTSCTPGVCSDGVIQAGEQCDDGNMVTDDDCPACQLAFCGDGYVRTGVEACDDGNLDNTDGCTAPLCETAQCGDGFIWAGVEECDDGNEEDGDQCPTSCTVAFCGDGFTLDGVEECDDANDVDDDTCTNDCISNGVFFFGMFTQNLGGEGSCAAWDTFRGNLLQFNNFQYIRIWGTADPTGVECMGAPANTICQALGSGQVANVMCNGRTWTVGTCGPGIELSANANCQCATPGYTSRPCIGPGNPNWGGVNTSTCTAPTQTIEVVCQ